MSYVNIGKVTEELNELAGDKVAKGHEVIEFQAPIAGNGYTWYRKYADGWVEQGGVYDRGSVATSWNTTITLPVMMQNTNYTAIVSAQWMDGDHLGENGINVEEKTTSSFKIYFYTGASGDGVRAACWEVKGMYAQ